jgi:hypothetical protein
MKRGKTRKNVNRYNMSGGQSFVPYPIRPFEPTDTSMSGGQSFTPYSAVAYQPDILQKLTQFAAEISDLSTLAGTYKTNTDNLNDTTRMNAHLTSADSLKKRAAAAYQKAREFWQSVYGTTWSPPPSPSPGPPVGT